MSREETETPDSSTGLFDRRAWGYGDLAAMLVFTAALAVFFWDVVSLRGALFYFDISEINFPYRAVPRRRAARRQVLALVPGTLLRAAAL